MKKPIFAVAALFIFMFTVVSGFSASETETELTTAPSYTATSDVTEDYINLTVKDILNAIIEIAKENGSNWEAVEQTVIKIVNIIENLGTGDATQEELDEAIAELEALGIEDAEGLIAALKSKIKSMYAGEIALIKVEIRTPSQTEIKYGDSIVLHADVETMPQGATIQWQTDNDNFKIVEISADGRTCTITPVSSGDTVFTASLVSQYGIHGSDDQTMTAKAGIFQKIIAFFKQMFNLTKVIPEAVSFIR